MVLIAQVGRFYVSIRKWRGFVELNDFKRRKAPQAENGTRVDSQSSSLSRQSAASFDALHVGYRAHSCSHVFLPDDLSSFEIET